MQFTLIIPPLYSMPTNFFIWGYIQIFGGAMYPLTLHLGVQRKWNAFFSFHMFSFCICCFFLSIWNKISICCCFECIIWTVIFWCLKLFGRLVFFAGVGTGSLTIVTLLLGSTLSSLLLLSCFLLTVSFLFLATKSFKDRCIV